MARTVPDLMMEALERGPDLRSIYWCEGGTWRSQTRSESVAQVSGIARGLAERGVGRGVAVAILSNTRPEWAAVDLAILSLRGVTVGIYPTLLPDQIAYQLRHSGVALAIVEDADQAERLASVRDQVPSLEEIVVIEPTAGWPSLSELAGPADLGWLRERVAEVEPDDVATHIYTSGTTGKPKAAVLLHRNFVGVVEATRDLATLGPEDRGVIWLPLAHSLQRFASYRGLLEDGEGWYAESIDKLPEALLAARPTVLASVPRMLEKIHHRAHVAVAERGGLAKRLFDRAFAIGHRRLAYLERGAPVPGLLELRWRFWNRLVFRKVRARMGGALRLLVSGGAALNPVVARWFGAMGVIVLEGWGLTETCAPATCNREDAFRIGTVGRPVPGVELRIAEDGEILVRGPGVFQGYHADPEASAACMTDDGWFRTGDIGTIDAEGFLRITDRKKEILVTAGGKNIAPVPIEKRIERSPYVSQAVVVGSERPYLVALLVPDDEALDLFGRQAGLPEGEDLAARVARPEVRALFEAAVAEANEGLARFETVKRWCVLPRTFSVESGELTPTLKLKRRVVQERHAEDIEALYA